MPVVRLQILTITCQATCTSTWKSPLPALRDLRSLEVLRSPVPARSCPPTCLKACLPRSRNPRWLLECFARSPGQLANAMRDLKVAPDCSSLRGAAPSLAAEAALLLGDGAGGGLLRLAPVDGALCGLGLALAVALERLAAARGHGRAAGRAGQTAGRSAWPSRRSPAPCPSYPSVWGFRRSCWVRAHEERARSASVAAGMVGGGCGTRRPDHEQACLQPTAAFRKRQGGLCCSVRIGDRPGLLCSSYPWPAQPRPPFSPVRAAAGPLLLPARHEPTPRVLCPRSDQDRTSRIWLPRSD